MEWHFFFALSEISKISDIINSMTTLNDHISIHQVLALCPSCAAEKLDVKHKGIHQKWHPCKK